MSTSPKELNPKKSSEAIITSSKKNVSRSIRTLMQEMEHENTLVQESPGSRLQRVLRIYRSVKPLFAILVSLPLLPSTWRAAMVMLDQALESLAAIGGDVTVNFKAGKDLAV